MNDFDMQHIHFVLCRRKNTMVLRTQLSVRVHACIGKFNEKCEIDACNNVITIEIFIV